MKYLLLIVSSEETWGTLSPAEQNRVVEGHGQFGAELTKRHKFVDSRRLRPVAATTTVRVTPGGGRAVTDGPFSETKEVLGGYYLIECESKAEAIEWAKQMPIAFGAVEVRPLWEMS